MPVLLGHEAQTKTSPFQAGWSFGEAQLDSDPSIATTAEILVVALEDYLGCELNLPARIGCSGDDPG